MRIDELRVCPLPGDDLVVRHSSAVGVLSTSDGAAETVTEILDALALASEGGGIRAARRLRNLIADAEPSDLPSFGALIETTKGIVLVLSGSMAARLDGDGAVEEISGTDSVTWVERLVAGGVFRIHIHPDADTSAAPRPDPHVALVLGVVAGGGVVVAEPDRSDPAPVVADDRHDEPERPEPSEPAEPSDPWEPSELSEPASPSPPLGETRTDHVAEVAEEPPTELTLVPPVVPPDTPPEPGPFELADLSAPGGETRSPLPIVGETVVEPAPERGEEVDGVLCVLGHLNDPDAAFCASCGRSMALATRTLVSGARPPLGYLVLDDGRTFSLDRDYVIGRDPDDDPRVRSGTARGLVLEDPDRNISRCHARIELRGWDVLVSDNESVNGTYVAYPGAASWTQLAEGEREKIRPTARVLVGSRWLVFESHHHT